MRLDKFLQVSRLIKRRTVANKVCSNGRVSINDQPAKAGREVAVGDKLTLNFGSDEKLICEVVEVPSGNVPKAKASSLYRVIEDTREGE